MTTIFQEGFETGEWSHDVKIFPVGEEPYETEVGNIFTPQGWLAWFLHDPGTRDQPEGRNTWGYVDPRRIHSGDGAYMLFSVWRHHDCGLMRQVQVAPGTRLRFTAWAHAWSNHSLEGHEDCCDDGRCSCGVDRQVIAIAAEDIPEPSGDPWSDAVGNSVFVLGIDPNGGTDPFSLDVEWGPAFAIYNGYTEQLEVEAVAGSGGTATVFLRNTTFYSFKHNDGYWDDVVLETVEGTPPPPPDGATKLGPHILRTATDLGKYLETKVAVAKFVGDWGMANSAPAGTLVIGRKHEDYDAQSQRARGLTPARAAHEFVEGQQATYKSNPQIVYWEGHNEPVWSNVDEMAWYAEFEVERMKLMAALGLKCVIGNFATGTPPLHLWPGFLSALKVARQYKAILGLHEYSCPWMWWMTGKYQIDPDEDEGDEGWVTLRYRKVYRQHLEPNGLGNIPLVVTECGIDPLVNPKPPSCDGGTWKQLDDYWAEHNDEHDKADYYYRQLVWYDKELQKDDYVVGATIFTWGNFGKPWADFDVAGTDVATKLIAYTQRNPAEPFVYPGDVQRGQPRVQYKRTYVLLPPGAGGEWAQAVIAATWDTNRFTLGGSADDAGIGDLDDRRVIAVNPTGWGPGLEEFFAEYYPGVVYAPVEADTPERLRQILADEDIALSQRDPRWADKDLGENPGGETIGQAGCLLTSFAMCLRHADCWIYPDDLNLILANAEIPFTNDDHLTGWEAAVELFSEFDDFAKVDTRRGAATLAGMLGIGWEIVLRMPGGTHFVYLESVRDDGFLNIIDPWDGQRKVRSPDLYAGIRAAHRTSSTPPPPPPSDFTLRGVHDTCGADWLRDNDLPGWCTVARYVGTDPQQLDLRQYADASVRVILRLSYSYAQDDGGEGTMPPPDKLAAHEDAVIETMRLNPDAWGFVYGNEPNNKREWPGGHDLTPAYYLESYNRIWARKPAGARLSPCAIDPYNAGWGDWRNSWYSMLCEITGCDFLALHAYTHGADPGLIWHKKEFEDVPLIGVYYDMRVLESQQDIIPSRFWNLPVVVTETNHWVKNDDTIGWEPDADDWVREAYKYYADHGVVGACLFRHGYTDWRYGDLPKILDALREIT